MSVFTMPIKLLKSSYSELNEYNLFTYLPIHQTWILKNGYGNSWEEKLLTTATIPSFKTRLELHKNFSNNINYQLENYYVRLFIRSYVYVDRGKVFKVNQNNPDNDKVTQYGRCLAELGIKLSFARSPEAKGRVERLFKTLQDRLVKELRLANISTITEANAFLQDHYIAKHNSKFAVAPRETTNLHQTIEGYNLDEILSIKEERILTSDYTIQYCNRWFQLAAKQPTLLFPKNSITVSRYLDNTINLSIRKMKLQFTEIQKPARKPIPVPVRQNTIPWKPAQNHPWRQKQIQQKVTFLNC